MVHVSIPYRNIDKISVIILSFHAKYVQQKKHQEEVMQCQLKNRTCHGRLKEAEAQWRDDIEKKTQISSWHKVDGFSYDHLSRVIGFRFAHGLELVLIVRLDY